MLSSLRLSVKSGARMHPSVLATKAAEVVENFVCGNWNGECDCETGEKEPERPRRYFNCVTREGA